MPFIVNTHISVEGIQTELKQYETLSKQYQTLLARLDKVNAEFNNIGGPGSGDPVTGNGIYSLDQLLSAKEAEINNWKTDWVNNVVPNFNSANGM